MLLELLPEHRIKIGVMAENWQDVVEKSGQILLRDGLIDSVYIKAMRDSILENGPYVVITQGVALLHARPEDGVNELGMSVLTLGQPVNFGNKDNDPVKVVFAFCAPDHEQHVEAIAELSEVLLQEHAIDGIYQAKNSSEVRDLIENVLRKD